MYAIGDYIVKAFNGVCRIEDILHLEMSGVDKNKLYYLLIPVKDNREKIYMPTDNDGSGVRKAMTEEDARNFIDRIPDIEDVWTDNVKLREQKYKEAVRNNNPDALIGIIKMSYMQRQKRQEQGKKGMAADEKYFKLAENSLYSELGFALNKSNEEVCKMVVDSIQAR